MATGYKTYVIAALIAVAAGAKYLGYIDQNVFETLLVLLGAGGLATTRAAINGVDKKLILVPFLLLALPSLAFAQLVVNPTKAEFNPSAEHSTVENEVALVSNYELRIFQPGGTTPFRTLNLGKPTPDGNNLITVSITTLIASLPVGDYFARVAAKGPGGEAVSEPSNPFQVSARPPTAPMNLRITK